MKYPGMYGLLEELQPRTLLLCLAALFGLTLLAAYLYLFKEEFHQYTQLTRLSALSGANSVEEQAQSEVAEVKRLQAEVAELRDGLYGHTSERSASQMVSYIIQQLDRLAERRNVQLVAVKPDKTSKILMFEEIPFDVEVRGRYDNLYAWLRDAERALRPMTLKQFRILSQNGMLTMHLRVVSYRPHADPV